MKIQNIFRVIGVAFIIIAFTRVGSDKTYLILASIGILIGVVLIFRNSWDHDLDTVLQSDGGILTRFMNGKHWHVTIIDCEKHITVVLDAYTGKLLTFILPLA